MFILHSTVFGDQHNFGGVVFETAQLSDENGEVYDTVMLYPDGVNGNDLALHLIKSNEVPPQIRIAVCGINDRIPMNRTGLLQETIPAVYTQGDVAIGDISTIESNGVRLGVRINENQSEWALTTIYSGKYSASDTGGGAIAQLCPTVPGGWNDGHLNLTAYGQGNGPLANTVFMRARSGADTIEEIAIFNGRDKMYPHQTNMSLMIHDGNNIRFEKVYLGAPNSGGPGKRALTTNN